MSTPGDELRRARATVEQLNQMLYDVRQDLEVEKRRHAVFSRELKAAQKEVTALSKAAASPALRLGRLLTRALRSPRALVRLPLDAWKLRAEVRAAKARKAGG